MDKTTEWKPEYYSQSTLKEFGFTAKMIETMLSEPVLKPNPHYKCAAPMKLWLITEVDAVMQTDEFKKAVAKRESRRNGAKKAVETKKNKLHAEIEEKIKHIKVKHWDLEHVRRQTISDKQAWYDYQASIRCNGDYRCAKNADEPTVRRWMVNYIRHNLTKYDDVLFEMSGRVGCHDEYYHYREAVLTKIAEVYPELKDECEQQ